MGVDFVRGRWRARVSVNGKRNHIGHFISEAYATALEKAKMERVRRARATSDPRERFFAKTVRADNGCLLWTGGVDKDGYGKFQLNGGGGQQHVRAHRYAYFLAHGKWPSLQALHSCDTPGCVEATHLSDGSQAENLQQCAARGRRADHVLTTDLVRVLRSRVANGESVTVVAASLGVCRGASYAAVHRRTWRHVS